ncbi:MAG TPA: PKD domain-containing protein, partial [Solirubrobacteraceae bacterium]|nr:PKD domain-containing protein [Solirubrobacteraceae bacterium]
TAVAWTDGTGAHLQVRAAGEGEFGPVQELGGATTPVELVALPDGAMVAAQQGATGIALWRRAPGGGAFSFLAALDTNGAPQGFVLRAGPGGGAVVAGLGRFDTTSGSPPFTTTTSTWTVRAARLLPGSAAFAPAETVYTATTSTGVLSPFGGSLGVEDAVLRPDGGAEVAIRTTGGDFFAIASTFRVARRDGGGTWPAAIVADRTVSAFDGTSIGDFRLTPLGSEVLATWRETEAGSGGLGTAGPATLFAARTSGPATKVPVATQEGAEPLVLDRVVPAGGHAMVLAHTGPILRALLVRPDGTLAETQTVPGDGTPQTVLAAPDLAGSVLVAAARQGADATVRSPAALYDGAAPAIIALDVPATVTAGATVRLAATVTENERATVTWELGDGHGASGEAVDVSWPAAGTRTVTVTAADGAGNVTTAQRTVEVVPPAPAGGGGGAGGGAGGGSVKPGGGGQEAAKDTKAPQLSALGLSRMTFATRGRRKGTKLTWVSSEAGRLLVGVERTTKGWRAGSACVARKPRRGKASRCTRVRRVGTLTVALKEDEGALSFTGKVGGKALAPGRYRFSLVAVDAAGNRSDPPRTIAFTVVR